MGEHLGAVAGLFDCAMLRHRVTDEECRRMQETDAGCPTDCPGRGRTAAGRVEGGDRKGLKVVDPVAEFREAKREPAKAVSKAPKAISKSPKAKGKDEKAVSEDRGAPVEIDGGRYFYGTSRRKLLLFDAAGECVGRVCTKCREPLLWDSFGKHKAGPRGRQTSCKVCAASRSRESWARKKKKRAEAAEPSSRDQEKGSPARNTNRNTKEPDCKEAAGALEETGSCAIEKALNPAEVLEGEFPSSEEILAAIEEGAYRAVIDVVAGAMERVAGNIRKSGAAAGGGSERGKEGRA